MTKMFSEKVDCWAELIGQWGIENFSSALGVKYISAQKMKWHNSVKRLYWDRVVDAAPDAGFHYVDRDYIWDVLSVNSGREFILRDFNRAHLR